MNRRRLWPLLRLTVSVVMIWWVYHRIPVADLVGQLGRLAWPPLLAVAALLLANTAVSAWKWQILLRANALTVSFGRLLVSYIVGTFFNIFLPSSIGGDAYRVVDIARRTEQSASAFASVLADRLSGFLALSLLALGAGLLMSRRVDHPAVVAIPVMGLTALTAVIGLLLQRRLVQRLALAVNLARFPRADRFLARLLDAFGQYRRRPGTMGRILLLSFGFHLSVAFCVFLMALSLHIRVPLVYFFTFVPLITLLEALPVSIYGLGIRDAAYAFFFAMAGMTPIQTRSLAVLYLAVNVSYALAGGIVFACGAHPHEKRRLPDSR